MRRPLTLEKMKSSLKKGAVYRRSDFLSMTSNVDRNLRQLVEEGYLKKLQNGLYLCPETTVFGESLPDENKLLYKFLKDDHFVVYGLSVLNSLGLGTTQLYNKKIVFNRKRHGEMEVGGRKYFFHRWREAPKKLTKEFLLVELVNHLDELAENKDKVLENLKKKLSQFDLRGLKYAVSHYGTVTTRNYLNDIFASASTV